MSAFYSIFLYFPHSKSYESIVLQNFPLAWQSIKCFSFFVLAILKEIGVTKTIVDLKLEL